MTDVNRAVLTAAVNHAEALRRWTERVRRLWNRDSFPRPLAAAMGKVFDEESPLSAKHLRSIAERLPNDDTWRDLKTTLPALIAVLETSYGDHPINTFANGRLVPTLEDINRVGRQQRPQQRGNP
jgi:hypothetical protein